MPDDGTFPAGRTTVVDRVASKRRAHLCPTPGPLRQLRPDLLSRSRPPPWPSDTTLDVLGSWSHRGLTSSIAARASQVAAPPARWVRRQTSTASPPTPTRNPTVDADQRQPAPFAARRAA